MNTKDLLLVDGQFSKVVDGQFTNELRVAQVTDGNVVKFQHQSVERGSLCGNIYWGKLVKQYKSLRAAFVDIGLEHHGFVRNYKEGTVGTDGDFFQVAKDLRGKKRPSLIRSISLTGRYVILYPNSDGSRSQVKINDNVNVVLRESAVGANHAEIKRDAHNLYRVWKNAVKRADGTPRLLYRDNDIVINAIRDMPYGGRVVVDGREAWRRIAEVTAEFAPDLKVSLHKRRESLFRYYDIESKTDLLYLQEIALPSGGSVVINQTEAMVTVDVNSRGSKRDAHQVNTEAAETIIEQINLRNLSGLIIIDFIDMHSEEERQAIYKQMCALSEHDGIYTRVGQIGDLGTMEVTRQRVLPSVLENVSTTCKHCHGSGVVLSVSCDAFKLLRDLRDALGEKCAELYVTAPQELVCYILNHQRAYLDLLERRFGTRIVVECGAQIEIRRV